MEKFEFDPEIEIVRFGNTDIVTTSGLEEDELPALPVWR
jgi:hypothetical protein